MTKLKPGKVIRHSKSGLEGTILSETRIKSLFELSGDEFEYRVRSLKGIKIWSPANVEFVREGATHSSQSTSETGREGVKFVCQELTSRGYALTESHSFTRDSRRTFASPNGRSFDVQSSYTKSGHSDAYVKPSYLKDPVEEDLFFIFLRPYSDNNPTPEFSIMTHSDVHAAWTLMPKNQPDGTPYVEALLNGIILARTLIDGTNCRDKYNGPFEHVIQHVNAPSPSSLNVRCHLASMRSMDS